MQSLLPITVSLPCWEGKECIVPILSLSVCKASIHLHKLWIATQSQVYYTNFNIIPRPAYWKQSNTESGDSLGTRLQTVHRCKITFISITMLLYGFLDLRGSICHIHQTIRFYILDPACIAIVCNLFKPEEVTTNNNMTKTD